MSRRVEQLLNSLTRERGNNNERMVRSAIQTLIDSGELDGVQNSRELDVNGIDFLVKRGPKKYKLSVKSSLGGIQHELEEFPERHRHRDKLFIIPGRNESREELGGRILMLINEFEEQMHRG